MYNLNDIARHSKVRVRKYENRHYVKFERHVTVIKIETSAEDGIKRCISPIRKYMYTAKKRKRKKKVVVPSVSNQCQK